MGKNRIIKFVARHSWQILWLTIAGYAIAISLLCFWKYSHFLYNSMDLAIFNNTLFNTVRGNFMWSSIQGHSYLGDHFSPILLWLLPFYYLWPSPVLLLITQSFFLGLAAWPFYLIMIKIFSWPGLGENKNPADNQSNNCVVHLKNIFPLLIALLWLINPMFHNANLYEFSALAFWPFLFFALFYFYLKLKEGATGKWLYGFMALWLLCLTIREDVAFTMIIFGILILWEKKQNIQYPCLVGRQTITNIKIMYSLLLVLSFGWLIASTKIISVFSPSNFSPFLIYYGWLREASFINLIRHLLSMPNLEMIIAGLAPLLLIPLIRPKWLLLTLIPLAQIVFSAAGGGFYVWKLHYGLLFLPAIFLSFIYSLATANNFVIKYLKTKYALLVALIIINIYLWADFGPFKIKIYADAANTVEKSHDMRALRLDYFPRQIVELWDKIGASSLLASYRYLPNFSSRENIYALNYLFLGKQQYGAADYNIKEEPAYILMDINDLLTFNAQYKNSVWGKKYYDSGDNRLRELLKKYGVMNIFGEAILFKKGEQNKFELYAINKKQITVNPSETAKESHGAGKEQGLIINNNINLLDYSILPITNNQLPITLTFLAKQKIIDDYQLLLEFYDGQNKYQKILPMAYGLYPTSEWQVGEKITVNYWFNLPVVFVSEQTKINLNLATIKGGNEINKMGISETIIDEINKVGETLYLNVVF